ncbi:MAG: hypothetical protein ACT6Q8_07595 [Niveispirillum sp.]|uniref:hypothetical protein n=1 Tax=Niveispirillum sp. TaxID=1917217 RepID=UPI004035A113
MRRRWKYALATAGILVGGLALAIGGPILYVEKACRADTAPAPATPSRLAALGYGTEVRPALDTYLSYPEWYIVHAYEDFAHTLSVGDESAFAYGRSVATYWSTLCHLNRFSSAKGEATFNVKAMLYTIGHSFALEMGAKAAYENTLGALSEWIRGPEKTEQDRLSAEMAADYVGFLYLKPWYMYDFTAWADKLSALPTDAPPSPLRSWERKIGIGLELRAKAAYAGMIGAAAAAGGEVPRTTLSIIRFTTGDLPPATTLEKDLGDGELLIRTARYRPLTDIMRQIALAGGDAVEIAGNDKGLATLIVPADYPDAKLPGTVIFTIPIAARPTMKRIGLDMALGDLGPLFRQLQADGAAVEHFYDY